MTTNDSVANKNSEKELDEILAPLLDLFTDKYSDGWDFHGLGYFQTGGAHGFTLRSNCDGRLVELPDRLTTYPAMARALATLLHRTGTTFGADEDYPHDEDPFRGPLRFSVVKKALWDNEFNSFLTGMHLLIEHFGYNTAAAERQIALLVDYLKDDANLVTLTPDDSLMF